MAILFGNVLRNVDVRRVALIESDVPSRTSATSHVPDHRAAYHDRFLYTQYFNNYNTPDIHTR